MEPSTWPGSNSQLTPTGKASADLRLGNAPVINVAVEGNVPRSG